MQFYRISTNSLKTDPNMMLDREKKGDSHVRGEESHEKHGLCILWTHHPRSQELVLGKILSSFLLSKQRTSVTTS